MLAESVHSVADTSNRGLLLRPFPRPRRVGLTVVTDDPVWDGIGTLCIGVLLGLIAIVLIVEMHSLLIGEGFIYLEPDLYRTQGQALPS